jgi:PBP1b-binding outer membrane lipoprotein LpoB
MKRLSALAALFLATLFLVACTTPCEELEDACDRCADVYDAAACQLIVDTRIQESCEVMLDELEILGCI